MLSEISSVYPIIFTIIWQSSLFITAGLMASYLCKRHPARAHQVLLLSMIAAVAVPFITIAVKHMDLGIFTANPEPAVEYIATSEVSVQQYDDIWGGSIQSASIEPEEHFAASVADGSEKSELPLIEILLVSWAAASLIFLGRLILTFILGTRMVKKAESFDYPMFEKSIKAASSRLGIKETVAVYTSKSVSSPVIWCWKRSPILLFPSSKRILADKMDLVGILCHELAHLKRRDHVAGLLSELMVVFLPWHPLLWWAKKRLSSLSEHACDDWVMAAGGSGMNYAESLLDLVPVKQMAFVPSVVRDKNVLKGRVMRILKGKYGNPRLSKKWILSAVIITTCISLMVACAQTRSSSLGENESPEALQESLADAGPSFGNATIQASNPNERGKAFIVEGNRFRTVNTTALELLTSTFGIHAKQLENAPAWLESEKYNIEAELDTFGALNDVQLKKMLEKLLADRMKLKFHEEERKVKVYALEVAEDGPRLDKSDGGPNSLPGLFFSGPGELNVRNANMTDFSGLMQEAVLDRPVVDRTGLQGRWNFTLKWTLDEAQSAKFSDMGPMMQPASDAAAPPLFTAVQQQIGLKFSSEKTQVPVIVIDHIEKPAVDQAAPAVRFQATAQDTDAPYRNVSIQLASAGPGGGGSILFNPGIGGLEIRGQTLRFVIAEAYGVNKVQVVGRDWDNEPSYNITAEGLKASESKSGSEFTSGSTFAPPSEMYGASLRELLAEEFGLVTSTEKGQLDGYALVVGDGEPKLTAGDDGMGNHLFGMTPEGFRVTSLPLSEVAKFLTNFLGGIVVDETGLEGNFDFEVKLTMSPGSPPDPAAISKALEEQVGLKIEARKLDVDMVNIVNLKPPEEVVTGLTDAARRVPEDNFAGDTAYGNVSIQLASAGPGEGGGIMFNPAGGLQITKQTLRFVIAEAYGVNEAQVVGRDWDNEPHYNITVDGLRASASTSGPAFATPSEMYGESLRELLADKFGLVTSTEKGQLDGYALLVGDGEPNLTVSAAGGGQHTFGITPEGLKITSLPLSEVTKFLSSLLGALVVDETGLEDNFDFEVKLAMSQNSPPDPAAITKALEEQVGLKIEARKLNVDVINVINLKPAAEVVTDSPSATVKGDIPGYAQDDNSGVGIEIMTQEQGIKIAGILPNSPASRAELSEGLYIRKIDGIPTKDKSLWECTEMIRGEAGSKVKLELADLESDKVFTVDLTRELIQNFL